jgi:hypothetical protein
MKINNVGDLPDDPLAMPPPYWRSSGAVFHIVSALEYLCTMLATLVPLNEKTSELAAEYFDRVPEPPEDDQEFANICEPLWDLEHRIMLSAEIAIVMSAIASEDQLNMLATFNLHKNVAEPLEKLSPPDKLQLLGTLLGHPATKGEKLFGELKRLMAWRNAFAHGHCTDRPVKSLRHNHLVSPTELPGVPSIVTDCIEFVRCYCELVAFLASISVNPYTAGSSSEIEDITGRLDAISHYEFSGNNWVYGVIYRD